MASKHNMLVCLSLILMLSILIPQLGALSQPIISISSNPVNYGQNDKITATATLHDSVLLYLNNTLVAGPSATRANYTVCENGYCPLPGTYVVTAYDNTTGASSMENIVVDPVAPTFTIQYTNTSYGDTDMITAYPAFYNDTMTIQIDDSQMSGINPGVFEYTICGSIHSGEECLPAGLHNVIVLDNTERVSSGSNATITVKPIPPKINIEYPNVKYGSVDNITVIAPLQTDQISLFRNSTRIDNGRGNLTYTICNPNGQQACIPPSTYLVYATDFTEGVNSSVKELNVSVLSAPTISASSGQVAYGTTDKITAQAAGSSFDVGIYIDGNEVATGTGKATYTICGVIFNDSCIPTGNHNVSAHDLSENLTSHNITISVTKVPPSVSVDYLSINFGLPDKIYGAGPFYNDSLSVLIDGASVLNGTGTATYVMCNYVGSPSCLDPGVYNVSIYDASEGAYSVQERIYIYPQQGANGTTTSYPFTSVQSNATGNKSAATKGAQSGNGAQGGQNPNYLGEIEGVIAAIIIVIVLVVSVLMLLRRRSREPTEMNPPNPPPNNF